MAAAQMFTDNTILLIIFLVVFIDVERVVTTLVRTGSTNRAVQVLERERKDLQRSSGGNSLAKGLGNCLATVYHLMFLENLVTTP